MIKLSNDFWYNLNKATGKILNPLGSLLPVSTATMASGARLGALGTAAAPLASTVALPFAGVSALNQISEMGYKGVNPYLNDLRQEFKDGSFPQDVLTAMKKPIGTTLLGGRVAGKAVHNIFKSTPRYDSMGKRLTATDTPKGATLLMNRISRPSRIAKRASDVLSPEMIQRMQALLNTNKKEQLQAVARLDAITNQFRLPSRPQVLNPLISRNKLWENPNTWKDSNGLLRFKKEVVIPAKTDPLTVLKNMIQRGSTPNGPEQTWGNLAMNHPVNAGFSNAVFQALLPQSQATNLVSAQTRLSRPTR